MNQLQIQSFRKLSPQDKQLLYDNYPDLYLYIKNLSETTRDYKTFKKLQKYSTQCKPNNIPNLTKKELINCLYRKLPYLGLIKKGGGIQYKQFLSSFLNTLRYRKGAFIRNSFLIFPTDFDIGPLNQYSTNYFDTLPYSDVNEINVRYMPNRDEHVTIYDYVTVDDFKKMIKILYPKFHDNNYINDLVSRCNIADTTNLHIPSRSGQYKLNGKIITPNTRVISLSKLKTFLIYIGRKFSMEANIVPNLTPTERIMYSRNFKFSYDQINRFMLAIPKEIYSDFLLNSDTRDTH